MKQTILWLYFFEPRVCVRLPARGRLNIFVLLSTFTRAIFSSLDHIAFSNLRLFERSLETDESTRTTGDIISAKSLRNTYRGGAKRCFKKSPMTYFTRNGID